MAAMPDDLETPRRYCPCAAGFASPDENVHLCRACGAHWSITADLGYHHTLYEVRRI
jgi:hypothetical protein